MALLPNLNDREYNKFCEVDGDHAVRTCPTGTQDVQFSGLSEGGKCTEVTLNSSTWVALPPTPLVNRNAVGVQNPNGADNPSNIQIKINHDSGVSGYEGIRLNAGGERYYDITDAVVIYAKTQSGTLTVTVEELA